MTTSKQFNFQKSFEELEELVAKFERGEVGLEEGLKEFERGLKLAEALKARLKEVENKVQQIKRKFGDDVEDEDGDRVSEV